MPVAGQTVGGGGPGAVGCRGDVDGEAGGEAVGVLGFAEEFGSGEEGGVVLWGKGEGLIGMIGVSWRIGVIDGAGEMGEMGEMGVREGGRGDDGGE